MAEFVENPKGELGSGEAMRCSFEKPFPRLDVILFNALAIMIEKA